MLLAVGLGNPGDRFSSTRHNAGFDVIDRVAVNLRLRLRRRLFSPFLWSGRGPVVLAKPLTFMNRSGRAVVPLLRSSCAGLDDLLIICDNIDLPVGSLRLKRRTSAGGHNGLASIVSVVGGEFRVLYVGVGRPSGGDVVEHVLSAVEPADRAAYERSLAAAADAVIALSSEPTEAVMNRVNRGP